MADFETIVKANDIRGRVPEEWGPVEAGAFGAAFARAAADGGSTSLLVGHDMRSSGSELARSFAAGAVAQGLDVVDIGLCSTDMAYYASGALGLDGAMLTASHNPVGYNGIKFMRAGARPVGSANGLSEIAGQAERYAVGGLPEPAETPGQVREISVLADYASYLRSLVDLTTIAPLRVVVDAGNGMGGLTVPAVLGTAVGLPALPITVIPLYFELDGSFPNHPPNPLVPENVVDLQRAVVAEKADLGLAFDGDADRCFIVDERGQVVNPGAITALVGLREIAREKAAGRPGVIIHNLITSRIVPELVEAAGGRAVRTRVGHAFIKETMAELNAAFGGEHSAHFYFRDFYYADTGMLAAMHVIAALAESGRAMSELAELYQPYSASGEINSTVADVAAAQARLRAAYAADEANGIVEVDELDGLTVSHWQAAPRWWFNVRASNTEPLLRLNVEAADEDIMIKIRDGVLGLIREDVA